MKTITQVQALPAMFQLKGEVQSKRDQAKALGRPMKSSVAMKEVARKYGYRSWEALQNAVTNRPVDCAKNSVAFLLIDGGDQALIINRMIVMTSEATYGDSSISGSADKIAEALGVELTRIDYETDVDVDGEEWTFEGIASKFGLIGQAVSESSSATGVGIVKAEPGPVSVQSFEEVLEIGRKFPEFRHAYMPYIDFDSVISKGKHAEYGEVDYVLGVTLNVTPNEPITAYHTCRISGEIDGFMDDLPPDEIQAQSKKMALDMLDRLIAAGINLDPSNIER